MPRFFFNHTSRDDVSIDEDGSEFPSLEAAYLDTCNAILDIAFEKLRDRQDPNEDVFEIVSERGDVLVMIPFSEVLRPHQVKDYPASRTSQLTTASTRLAKRHQALRAEFSEEFARTETTFKNLRSTLIRLDAACSPHWPRAK
jgi:hypothetical protein